MSLADLKKKKDKKPVKKLSVEDFIDDATAYSQGQSQLGEQATNQPATMKRKNNKRRSKRRTKHATFSLSQECIVQLNELTKETGINKSKLVRLLVDSTTPNTIKEIAKHKNEK